MQVTFYIRHYNPTLANNISRDSNIYISNPYNQCSYFGEGGYPVGEDFPSRGLNKGGSLKNCNKNLVRFGAGVDLNPTVAVYLRTVLRISGP